MGIRLIRKSSDSPNVSNKDDARMIRYAYGYQDGILKNVGAQVASSVSGNTFRLGSGVLVLQGWELEIDANGWSMVVDNVATKRYYAVYLEVNLATETAEIKSMYTTTGVPTVDTGADLSTATTGTARLVLYTFSSLNGVISDVAVVANMVVPWTAAGYAKEQDLTNGVIVVKTAQNASYASSAGNATHASTADSATSATRATYASADTSKGTIEQRLTNLGFRSGVVAMFNSAITPSTNFVKRQGNYVYGQVACENMSVGPSSGGTLFTLPVNFRPKTAVTCGIGFQYLATNGMGAISGSITFATSGTVTVTYTKPSGFSRLMGFNILFGFEATAIT